MTEEMQDKFEEQLTHAMRRVDAPQEFAARIMDQAANSAESRPKVITMRLAVLRAPVWFGGAIAAVLVVGMFGLEQVHVRHQREANATQQFETASRITDQALDHTRSQLAKAGVSLDQ